RARQVVGSASGEWAGAGCGRPWGDAPDVEPTPLSCSEDCRCSHAHRSGSSNGRTSSRKPAPPFAKSSTPSPIGRPDTDHLQSSEHDTLHRENHLPILRRSSHRARASPALRSGRGVSIRMMKRVRGVSIALVALLTVVLVCPAAPAKRVKTAKMPKARHEKVKAVPDSAHSRAFALP